MTSNANGGRIELGALPTTEDTIKHHHEGSGITATLGGIGDCIV